MSIKVFLADDQAMIRTGLRMILEIEPDIEIIGEAEDGQAAVDSVIKLKPEVVLMDIQMPKMDGLEATRQILAMKDKVSCRILILTTFERDEYIFEALRLGACGFLLKNAPPEDLVSAIRIVAKGDALLSPSVTRRIIEEFARLPPKTIHAGEIKDLTEREIEVLQLIARGQSNSEIANKLVVSEATVKTHVSNLFSKLSLRDRVQAVVFAYENGLVQPGTK
jgi:DNA-binding NarL/FixJ family response regulator